MIRKLSLPSILLAGLGMGLFIPGEAAASPAERDKAFLAVKKEILVLALERTRTAHYDYQRTLVMGETRLKRLHENYQVAGSTPPTVLDRDLQELRTTSQRVRLQRSRGQQLPADPQAAELIEKYWEIYDRGYQQLREEVTVQKDA